MGTDELWREIARRGGDNGGGEGMRKRTDSTSSSDSMMTIRPRSSSSSAESVGRARRSGSPPLRAIQPPNERVFTLADELSAAAGDYKDKSGKIKKKAMKEESKAKGKKMVQEMKGKRMCKNLKVQGKEDVKAVDRERKKSSKKYSQDGFAAPKTVQAQTSRTTKSAAASTRASYIPRLAPGGELAGQPRPNLVPAPPPPSSPVQQASSPKPQLPPTNARLPPPAQCTFYCEGTPVLLQWLRAPIIPELDPHDYMNGLKMMPADLEEWHDTHWVSHDSSHYADRQAPSPTTVVKPAGAGGGHQIDWDLDPKSNATWTHRVIPSSLLPAQHFYDRLPDERDGSVRRKKMEEDAMFDDGDRLRKYREPDEDKLSPDNTVLEIHFWDGVPGMEGLGTDAPHFGLWNLKNLYVSLSHIHAFIRLTDVVGLLSRPMITIPVRIHLTVVEEDEWKTYPVLPETRCLSIHCRSFDYSPWHITRYFKSLATRGGRSISYYDGPDPQYETFYEGGAVSTTNCPPIIPFPAAAEDDDILIHPGWNRVFPFPGSSEFESSSTIESLSSYRSVPSSRPKDNIDSPEDELHAIASGLPIMPNEGVYGDRGWYVKAWIPIPTWMFEYRDTVAFRVEAAVWVGDETSGGLVKAKTDFTISSLMVERELGLVDAERFGRQACV